MPGRILLCHPVPTFTITWRYTSPTQSRDALHVQPRLRGEGETSYPQLEILSPSHPRFSPSHPYGRRLSILRPGFLRPLAFSTNGHNYVHVPIHNPHCQPRLPHQPFYDKVPSVYSRYSRPISHFPTLAIPSIIVYLLLSRSFRAALSFRFSTPLSFPLLFAPPSLYLSLFLSFSVFRYCSDKRIRLKRERERKRNTGTRSSTNYPLEQNETSFTGTSPRVFSSCRHDRAAFTGYSPVVRASLEKEYVKLNGLRSQSNKRARI